MQDRVSDTTTSLLFLFINVISMPRRLKASEFAWVIGSFIYCVAILIGSDRMSFATTTTTIWSEHTHKIAWVSNTLLFTLKWQNRFLSLSFLLNLTIGKIKISWSHWIFWTVILSHFTSAAHTCPDISYAHRVPSRQSELVRRHMQPVQQHGRTPVNVALVLLFQ